MALAVVSLGADTLLIASLPALQDQFTGTKGAPSPAVSRAVPGLAQPIDPLTGKKNPVSGAPMYDICTCLALPDRRECRDSDSMLIYVTNVRCLKAITIIISPFQLSNPTRRTQ